METSSATQTAVGSNQENHSREVPQPGRTRRPNFERPATKAPWNLAASHNGDDQEAQSDAHHY